MSDKKYKSDDPDEQDLQIAPTDESRAATVRTTDYEKLLDRLGRLAQKFGTARDLRTIYQSLYEFALASTPCSSIGISLVDKAMRSPVFACCGSQEIDTSGVEPIKISGESPHTMALLSNEVVIIDDLQEAMSNRRLVPLGFDIDPTLPQSSLIAPMSVMGRIVGSFEIQSNAPSAFNREHAIAMRMAANLAAVAIENVRLFDREHEREEQLRQSQKMEAVGRLAGGVAHDFNNLLTAIIGYSQLIAGRLGRDDPLLVDIKEIEKAGNRAASLTRQLLAFSRKQVLLPKVVDLNHVISEMQKMVSRLIGEDIELTTNLDRSLGKIKADPGQLEQVLMNLCINARDAMAHGGKLEIQTSNVELSILDERVGNRSLAPGRYVRLTVTDNGPGMDKETLSHVFEPFFTTKEVGKGTGLGLSTVYGIVSQSGGDISVESERDVGTTFTLYFPIADFAEDSVGELEPGLASTQPHETVLLAEDEPVVRRLVADILSNNGYKVLKADNGDEAMLVCAHYEGEIQLLVTDLVMPQMSGRELAERALALRPNVKVLYMSGYTSDSTMRHGLAETEYRFIQKPFTPAAFLSAVRSILDDRKAKDSVHNGLHNSLEDSESKPPMISQPPKNMVN